MGTPVTHTLTGVAAADGTASALYSVPPSQPWTLERMAATGTSALVPELRVYRNGTLIDATGNANTDASSGNAITLLVGDQIRADWSKATPSASLTLVMEGTAL